MAELRLRELPDFDLLLPCEDFEEARDEDEPAAEARGVDEREPEDLVAFAEARDREPREREPPDRLLLRWEAGISAFTTSLVSVTMVLSRNLAIRSSWRRYSFASFAVSLSPTASARV